MSAEARKSAEQVWGQRRPTWETQNLYCSHGRAPYMLCGDCNREAAQEEIQRETMKVLRELGKVLELLAHPTMTTSESKP